MRQVFGENLSDIDKVPCESRAKGEAYSLSFWGLLCLIFLILAINFFNYSQNLAKGIFGGPQSQTIEVIRGQANLLPAVSGNYCDCDSALISQNRVLSAEELDRNEGIPESLIGYLIVSGDALTTPNSPLTTFITDRSGIMTYEVVEGDNPSKIAANFGISLRTLLWANDLSFYSTIKPGQKLVVLPVSGVIHQVKEGDTLSEIASFYKADLAEILEFNHLKKEEVLKPGTTLIIPDGVMPQKKIVRRQYLNQDLASFKGYFARPTTGWNWGILHPVNAVDIANVCGTAVLAAAEGLVVEAKSSGWNNGYGKYIKIQHPNGTFTLYAHLKEIFVKVGDYVQKGKTIAEMGNTGKVKGYSGCHLHFEVRGAKNPLAK